METESISSILSSETAPVESTPVETAAPTTPTAPPAKAEEQPKPVEKPRDESGKFAKSAEDKPKLLSADVAAIIDERRKRQEAESKLKELQGAKPKTDFYDNAEVAIKERLSEELAPLKERFFKISLKAAQSAHADYDAAAQAFADAAEKDGRLFADLRDHDDPGEFIYSVGKQISELSDVGGDLSKYKEKITAETSAKLTEATARISALEAQIAALQAGKEALDAVPKSLNGLAGGSPKVADTDPEDIKSIVRFGKTKG